MAERSAIKLLRGGLAETFNNMPQSYILIVEGVPFTAAPTDGIVRLQVFLDNNGNLSTDTDEEPVHPVLREVYQLGPQGIPVDAVTLIRIPFGSLDKDAKIRATKEIWQAANRLLQKQNGVDLTFQLAPAIIWDRENAEYVRI